MVKRIYEGRVSGTNGRGRPQLSFQNLVDIDDTGSSCINQEYSSESICEYEKYAETVSFGALFSLATVIEIKRPAKKIV